MNGVAALAGNPNCGKTTLFNALTGSHQYVGNWPGVTVEKREAIFDVNDAQITLIDLPGAYSLTPYSIEERVTADYLAGGEAGAVINIVDAMHLERSLLLTLQLLNRRLPVVVAINMMDELAREGGKIDIAALSNALGCPVVAISARRKTGFDELFSALYEKIAHPAESPAVLAADEDEEAIYQRVSALLRAAGYEKRRGGSRDRTGALDRILTGRYTAFPILLAVLLFMFFLAFGAPGAYLTGLVGGAVDRLRALTLWLLLSLRLRPCAALPSGRQTFAGALRLPGAAAIGLASVSSLYAMVKLGDGLGMIAGVLGIAAAFCLLVDGAVCFTGQPVLPGFRIVPYLFLAVRTVTDFRGWSIDPAVLDYCFQHFALLLSLCGLYAWGSFCFDRGCRRLTAFLCLAGVGSCAMAAAGLHAADLWLYIGLGLALLSVLVQLANCEAPDGAAAP